MWHELDLSMAWMNLGVIRAIDNRVNRDRYDWIRGFFFCDESWVVITNRKLQRLFWRFVAAWGNLRVWVERWLNLSEECQGLRSRQAGDFLKHDKKVYRYTDIQDIVQVIYVQYPNMYKIYCDFSVIGVADILAHLKCKVRGLEWPCKLMSQS